MHRKYREAAVEFIEENKEQYAPFIEDDETIDQYLGDMRKDGIWGGQMEIQALSIKFNFNVIVHQVDNPIMAFENFPRGSVPTVHISYHLGEHYNSVRLADDIEDGPAKPIGHELKPVIVEEQKDKLADIVVDSGVDQINTESTTTSSQSEIPTVNLTIS